MYVLSVICTEGVKISWQPQHIKATAPNLWAELEKLWPPTFAKGHGWATTEFCNYAVVTFE